MSTDLPTTTPLLIDMRDAAELLGVCPEHVWRMTNPRGPLPAVRIGRRLKYSPEALREWIRQQSGLPTNASQTAGATV